MGLNSAKVSSSFNMSASGGAGLASLVAAPNLLDEINFTIGTGDGAVDRWHGKEYTVGAGADVDIDLAGVVADDFGTVTTFAKLKAIKFVAGLLNDGVVDIGGEPTNPLDGGPFGAAGANIVPLSGGDQLIWTKRKTGLAVVAGTGDKIRLHNNGAASATVKVMFFGTSA